MSKLNVDQKSIKDLFQNNKADFLIPDYQRPYAWEEKECQTLWDDIFAFAFPDSDYSKFDSGHDEYFLGPIVTFKNDDGKMEVIDGQQRLTTLMLLLRAFYSKFENIQDSYSLSTRANIEKCIWKTDEFGTPEKTALKIDSQVATDNDKDEFLTILKNGETTADQKSKYAVNYRSFVEKINDFLNKYPSFFSYFPTRILNNCILLPIEAESQDTALRIFSTLNDRGKPLSDADIFKAQFYKYYSAKGEKDKFMEKWKSLEDCTDKIFHPISGTPMDELFTRYMYYERAKLGIKTSTTESLRNFYERNKYDLLHKNETLENLISLATFWNDIFVQDKDRFSDNVLRRLFILEYAPNGMWTYFVSVYFMKSKDIDGNLDNDTFCSFLDKIIAFIWTYALVRPGVNALRTPLYSEMINIVEGESVTFEEFKFDKLTVVNAYNNFAFLNGRPLTKSMLAWWAFHDDDQEIPSLEINFEIEHIFAKNREDKEGLLKNINNLDSLGNKSLLEKKINIRASDYRFSDKKRYYNGFTSTQGKLKEGTKIKELLELSKNEDFVEKDIEERNNVILNQFIANLEANNLIK
jgi:uncharacterized protein with ParB-like and HNH nuclease domain